ncbi:MAG TPA: GlxA family transcriptional regulator [Acidimicrobiia bacterium]
MTRRVVILAFDDLQLLDVVGPAETFAMAAREQPGAYEVVVAAATPTITASSGLVLGAACTPAEIRGRIDTLIVPGGRGTAEALRDPAYLDAVRTLARRSRRITSVCSGAYLLAEAGLLDGKRATTHWSECERFARRYPNVALDGDAIYVHDGACWTSAGVTAGIDLSLALVDDDLGRDVALAVARQLVVFMRRPGGQSQFSAQLASQAASRDWLRELQAHIAEHPEADLSVAAIAQRCHMSERHLSRVFTRELGVTPAGYVERARVDVARGVLEQTALGLDAVADACGFGSVETLRRAFHRNVGVAPHDYRARFRRAS